METLKKNLLSAVLLVIMALFSAEALSVELASIKPDRARLLLKESSSVWLVDIRNPDTFASGHIEGSLNIPAELLEVKQFPKGKRLVLIDDSVGQTAAGKSARFLSSKGIQTSVLEGGIRQWRRDGFLLTGELPVVSAVTAKELRDAFAAKVEFRILDLRAEEEFIKVSLPGASLLKGADIFERVTALKKVIEIQNGAPLNSSQKGSPIILILPKGQNVRLLEENIRAENVEVRYLLGGLEAWASSFSGKEQKTIGTCPYCTTKTQINR
jgi:rhodanese-related sulfurtransferase